jgi:hypothetical protein
MGGHRRRPQRPVQDGLHPYVYRAIVALTIWLVFSVWALFDRGAGVALNLLIVTVFFVVAVGVPSLIALTRRRNLDERPAQSTRFRDWAAGEFATGTGPLSGRAAAMQILLPIAAVAIGMTIFGLVLYFDLPEIS